MKHLISITLACLLLSACATQTFDINGGAGAAPTKQSRQHFFLSGLGQQKGVNAAAVCGGGDRVARVEVQQTFVDAIFGAFTMGIYTPRNARVYCKR